MAKSIKMAEDSNEVEWNTPKARIKFVISQTWRFFFSICVLLFSLVIFLWKPAVKYEKAPYGLYITAIMAVFWISECIPLPVTSLIPVILIPLFGIQSSDEICGAYFNQLIMFLFGGCVVALAFEYSNLHTRIALFVMKSVGSQASVLHLGMMATCMFLSCWMNNTSTAAMMVPVIFSIMDQYKKKLIPDGTPQELAAKFGNPLTGEGVPKESVDAQKESKANMDPMSSNAAEKPPAPTEAAEPQPDENSMIGTATSPQMEDAVRYWEQTIESNKEIVHNLQVMFLIGVAASSNIGGTGVITGSGTNLVATNELSKFKNGLIDPEKNKSVVNVPECFSAKHAYWELDFVRWSVINFLPMLVNTFLCWCFLALYYQGLPRQLIILWRTKVLGKRLTPGEIRSDQEKAAVSVGIKAAIREKYVNLGKTTLHEWLVIIFFCFLVLLWVFRNPLFLRPDPLKYNRMNDPLDDETILMAHPSCRKNGTSLKLESGWGWARFFGDKCDDGYMHDYVATWIICFFLFIMPKDAIYYKRIFSGGLDAGLDHPVLPMEYGNFLNRFQQSYFTFVAKNMPWGPIFMLGGGIGISVAIRKSTLGDFLGDAMQNSETLKHVDSNTIMAIIFVFVSLLTMIASNTATAFIVSPIVLALAQAKGLPPLYMLIPPIVIASYSFILPISTPPNAIVYDKGNLKQSDMIKPGIFLTLICYLVFYLYTITAMKWILNVGNYKGECVGILVYTGKTIANSGIDNTTGGNDMLNDNNTMKPNFTTTPMGRMLGRMMKMDDEFEMGLD